jgi:hypothetical protein
MRVIEAPGELTDPNGSIAIMSPGQGSIANNVRGGFEIYRASKSASTSSCAATPLVTTTPTERCSSWPLAG